MTREEIWEIIRGGGVKMKGMLKEFIAVILLPLLLGIILISCLFPWEAGDGMDS